MALNKVWTVKLLAEKKAVSVEEFRVLAERKGIIIPEDDEGVVSIDTIKALDPSLAYHIRFEKSLSIKPVKSSADTKESSLNSDKASPAKNGGDMSKNDFSLVFANTVINELRSLKNSSIEDEEKLKKYLDIQNRWYNIGHIPKECAVNIVPEFWQLSYDLFDSLSPEISSREYSRNLQEKRKIIKEAIELSSIEDRDIISEAFKDISLRWRSIGLVAKEEKDSLQEQYRNAMCNANNKMMRLNRPRATRALEEGPNSDNKRIGIVKWYDSNKGFGFVCSSAFRSSTIGVRDGQLEDIYINDSSVTYTPHENEFVVFSTIRSRGKTACAPGVRRVEATREDINLALEYRGGHALISGTDIKSGHRYNEHVLTHIKRICSQSEGGDELFANCVIDYIEHCNSKSLNTVIDELISENLIRTSLAGRADLQQRLSPQTYSYLKRSLLVKELSGKDVNWTIIQRMTEDSVIPKDIEDILYKAIVSHSSISGNFEEFLISYGEDRAKTLFSEKGLGSIPSTFYLALSLNSPWKIDRMFNDNNDLPDAGRVMLYMCDGDPTHLNGIKDWKALVNWLGTEAQAISGKFIATYVQVADLDEDPVIRLFSSRQIADSLFNKDDDEKYQFIQLLPEEMAIKLVTEQYTGTSLYHQVIREKWTTMVSNLSYVVFDLESDGENIKEFSFKRESNTRSYTGEEQIKSLLRALSKEDIIVGHRIKDWDLKILETRGLSTSSFIWDTLEIEILLNPCRYAYALHTSHNSKDDTELTDRLFWNQLFRLSQQPELCDQLSDFLPKSLNGILVQLREPYYEPFFKSSSNDSMQFFQELAETDKKITDKLSELETVKDESSLIVAPMNLWGAIARHTHVRIYGDHSSNNWKTISAEKLSVRPLTDRFQQATMLRFISMSATPVVANLAQYLRLNYFTDDILEPYLEDSSTSSIVLTDLNHLNEASEIGGFPNIVFIGKELEGRFSKFTLPDLYPPSFFLERNCWIPMRMAGANYMLITKAELENLCISGLPEDVSNVWVERQLDGLYRICYNFDFEARILNLKAKNDGAKISYLDWEYLRAPDSIQLLGSHPGSKFNAMEARVGSISRYRSLYWVTQLKMLSAIAERESGTPLIYFIENDIELASVESHARSLGFNIPDTGTLARRIEMISHREKGLIIVSCEKFWDIVALKDHTKYIFVWDSLSVDKCRMMWNGKMPFGDEADSVDNSSDRYTGLMDATPKRCLLATWPTMEFRYRSISANNPNSRLYVMDPYLDDFLDLSDVWRTESFRPVLWKSEEAYKSDLTDVCQFYKEADYVSEINAEDERQRIEAAMETIRKIFHFNEWKNSQKDVLPEILSRRGDYLVSIPTGGGKSVLFQGPALYNATFSNRLSIVITPLKALMEDQVLKLHSSQFGFYTNVDYLNGDRSQVEIQQIYRKVKGGELALLYVTPERFRSRSFLNAIQTRIEHDNGLEYFIFDEAHCVSQWGQEFRPDYLNVMNWVLEVKRHYPATCVSMYSATVTKGIQEDIKKYLPDIKRLGQDEEDYNPIRSHIGMSFISVGHDDESRLKEIVKYIKENHIDREKSRMILFCRTRIQCEQCALALEQKMEELNIRPGADGLSPIGFFHAGMDAEDRDEVYNKFKDGDIFILCATKAFGMGMDISNVHYILHYSPPSVLEDYLQEVGRAGRNEDEYIDAGFSKNRLLPAACLVSKEDFKKAKELLLKSMLSWTNLNEIRKAILGYITKIQSVEETENTPIVVPLNLWQKDQLDDSYTAYRIGLFWLERMVRFRTGFLCPAHINIAISNSHVEVDNTSSNTRQANAYKVYKYIVESRKDTDSDLVQVSVNELRANLKMGNQSVLNAIVTCTKNKWLKLEQSMRCSVTMIRNSETAYLLKSNRVSLPNQSSSFRGVSSLYYQRLSTGSYSMDNTFALGIVFKAISNLLSEKQLHKEYIIDSLERNRILSDAIGNAAIQTVTIRKQGKVEQYMPWYDNEEKSKKNIGLSIAKNYRKDLVNKRAKHIFTILQMIPNVVFKSFIDTSAGEVKQSISITSTAWNAYLEKMHSDCVLLLKYISDKNNEKVKGGTMINWADCIIALDIEEQGYQYLDTLLHVLKVLGYIHADSMLPIGLEIFTTKDSDADISNKLRPASVDVKVKEDFDMMNKMRQMRLAAMNAFSGNGKTDMNHFISEYFKCYSFDDFFNLVSQYYDESNPDDAKFMASIRDEAIVNEEKRLGVEQRDIYNSPIDEDINVLAGPGSGKTHTLTLRCARLIYRESVSPDQILVLAYNRAVVVELRNRLDSLFGKLGLGRSASQVHVHTFSALAKIVLGRAVDELDLSEWEDEFLKRIKERPQDVRAILPNIRYIMIDEFQDITQTRLDAMLLFREIYQDVRFFTIGDKDQSIYGFDKRLEGIPESTNPDYYYKQLREAIHPHEFTMKTNYRSYPKILEVAAAYLESPQDAPNACHEMTINEPKEQYVGIINWKSGQPNWDDEFQDLVNKAHASMSSKNRRDRIEDIAIFFRTNNEVFRGYEKISKMNFHDVRIRIQGASGCELFRVREIYTIIDYLKKKSDMKLVLNGSKTKKEIHDYIVGLMESHPNWDRFYLDFAYTLVLDYLDYAASEEESLTYGQMAESIIEMSTADDGQIYKIYDRYENERIDRERQLNIILTTMHKVKGLEFDAVVVTPSFASLPLRGFDDEETNFDDELDEEETEDLKEERRLMYVAYTRARKVLRAYKYTREMSLDKMKKMKKIDARLGYSDSNGIGKFFLSFLAQEKYFSFNDYIDRNVRKNDILSLAGFTNEKEGYYGKSWKSSNYYLKHNGQTIGRLAASSGIVRAVNAKMNNGELQRAPELNGAFVNEVFVWTYDDTVKYDNENNTDFSKYWSNSSKEKGFIYIVDFAGYVK